MKKIAFLLIIPFFLLGCEVSENTVTTVENTNENQRVVYSEEELTPILNKILSSEEEFLKGISYFQSGIQEQEIDHGTLHNIIWLQIDSSTTEFSEIELKELIVETLKIEQSILRVDIEEEKIDYMPASIPWIHAD